MGRVCVIRCYGCAAVPKQVADRERIHPRLIQARTKCMAQVVKTEVLNAGIADGRSKGSLDLGNHSPSSIAGEQILTRGQVFELNFRNLPSSR